jgi:hypothetical protein
MIAFKLPKTNPIAAAQKWTPVVGQQVVEVKELFSV